MDTVRIEKLGTAPLAPELKSLAALRSSAQLPATFAHFARLGINGPVGVFVGADGKHSTENIVQLSQSGLGMPDREYYLKDDPKLVSTRAAYVAYITQLLTLAKQPDPAGAATRILALETQLAKVQWARSRNRDRDSTYNKMTVAQLSALTPSYNWKSYLDAAGLSKATEVVVRQLDYVKALDPIIASTPASTWRDYLTFRLVDRYADELPSSFVQARFAFRGKALSGQQEPAARWKQAADGTVGTLGEAAGTL
jgi:predicted metalloendopeptidase